jgi:beta-galactosidase GanA
MNLIRRVLIFLSIIGCLSFAALWYWPNISNANKVDDTKYVLTAYCKDAATLDKVKKIAEERQLTFKTHPAQRFEKRKIGYRVVFRLNDDIFMKNMLARLKEKKVKASVEKDENDEEMLIIGGNTKDKVYAEKVRKKAVELTLSNFRVEDNFKKFPIKTTAVVIENVVGADTKRELRQQLREITKDEVDRAVMKDQTEAPPEDTKGKKDAGKAPAKPPVDAKKTK